MSSADYNDFHEAIAVIGMAGRFPGAATVDELWQNLADGRESIRRFSDAELLEAGIDPALLENPRYVKAGAFMENADLFDAEFFGLTPREARCTDPQHRIFLECAWQALEHAGYDPHCCEGPVGVFAGCSLNTYFIKNLLASPETLRDMNLMQLCMAN